MKWLLTFCVLLFAMLMMGCTARGELLYDTAVERAEDAVDAANQLALRQLCKNMTRGSYNRMCQGNAEMCAFMDGMCAKWQGEFKQWSGSVELQKQSWRERGFGPVLIDGKWY